MKVKTLISKLYTSILSKDQETEKHIWFKILKKSLKKKNTVAIK